MNIDFIGMPLFLGASTNGMERGPLMIRRTELDSVFASHHFTDKGDVPCHENTDMSIPTMKNVMPIMESDYRLADEVYSSLVNNHFPLIFGGDHSLSWGSIAGVTRKYDDIAIIYIDAHGDFNTEQTSETHNVHGMHMAYLMGFGDLNKNIELQDKQFVNSVNPQSVFFVGSRALDQGELDFKEKYNMNVVSSEEVRNQGWEIVSRNVTKALQDRKVQHVHISLDIDVMDPSFVPGTGVPEVNGLNPEGVNGMLGYFLRNLPVVSMDLVEYNPRLDKDEKTYHVCLDLLKTINDSL
jgi:arginase